jgi:AGZA family xanthine/uracil permease-like MFS transporter
MKTIDQPAHQAGPARYDWFVVGDINGFFGLAFDNFTVLSFLAGILIFGFQFPADIVYKRMFPGTAFGVLVGDLIYTWMAFRLAKRTGNRTVTAMPLGLDTPSTIGLALTVLGPAFIALKAQGMAPPDAAMMTWYIGMATMVFMGIVKLILSFAGPWVQRVVPQAGLLGSIAGVGLALLGYLPVVEILGLPLIGMASLGIILYALIAHIRLPKNFPGVFAAVLVGCALYYTLGPLGLAGGTYTAPSPELHIGFPIPTLDFLKGMAQAIKYLPIALPFGLLTVIGGINVTESARVAGDDFDTRQILLAEAISTLVAGVCGGVAQSTPYIGQPAFKQMGSRAGYTLLTGVFIGLGGMLGYVSFIVELIPRAVIAPILVFVALEIICQAFIATPQRHAPAVAFAFFPIVAQLVKIELSNPDYVPIERFNQLLAGTGARLPDLLVTVALGNGFILTSMLWGAFVAKLIDRQLRSASLYLFICAVLTFFGVIHSALPEGNMYLPWSLPDLARRIPYQFTAAYLVLAAMLILLSLTKESHEGNLSHDF